MVLTPSSTQVGWKCLLGLRQLSKSSGSLASMYEQLRSPSYTCIHVPLGLADVAML